ncbi:MAG: hypothetical protein QGI50_08935 [Dehalococcoidia bacterium]|nr:hypothetical protein [Dehalococcoidia bacterium]MDP7201067.1 hypothetical protein [Dehalococcoidia bacterium]HJN87685.1 hypothetical protein [Dehalococcoidia bacterium]
MLEDAGAIIVVLVLVGVGGLALLVGMISSMVLIVFWTKEGNPGPNKYGPDPRLPASH